MSTKKTIAKSFTVSTIEDGVSVQAQYAPNANPTSDQIHTVWQEGDLYMRTRESDDAAWSSWHKIVGENGESAPAAFASPAQISVPCYSNGNVKAQKITSVFFSLKVGTNTATVTSCSDGTKPTGVTVQGRANHAVTITVGTSATASGLSAGVTFTVTGTYGGKTYSATVTVALIGSTQGEVGRIGRFFYYAGKLDDFASTDSFLVNDAQAPYFYYNYNYWVFNPETNGTYTKQDMGTPSSSSSKWKLMTSDFKYIITEAIFGAYAHFGSFIINGDWMISTNGTINGVLYENGQNFTYNGETKPAYMWFDASNPNNNTGHNFLPNFAVDGRSGDSYQNNGTFKGIVTSNLSYSPTDKKTGNDDVILNPQSDKCGTFLISGITTVKNIYLPLASQYDGLEYNLIQAVYVNDEYKNCYINRSGSDQIYVPANNKLTAVTMFTLPPNMIVKLKSINGSWYAWM